VSDDHVAVYIVTYRRHEMLRRSIASVLAQTHRNLTVKIINDDPADGAIPQIIESTNDLRVKLFQPQKRRGATANFNLVFQETAASYTALLEDDNWWEPNFLERQIGVLKAYPLAPLVVSNERIWKEMPGSDWKDTGRTIWPFRDVRMHEATLPGICGSTVVANSSMLVRSKHAAAFITPNDIPTDVTEHFRERLMPSRFPLNGEVLVNFAETMRTARGDGLRWGLYQIALIGSVFIALRDEQARRRLAQDLWRTLPSPTSPRATTLVATGLGIVEARELLLTAPRLSLLRTAATYLRHPKTLVANFQIRNRLAHHVAYLSTTPLVRELVFQ
jgi:glycosyltransferase involved in cell wall biosynthesis